MRTTETILKAIDEANECGCWFSNSNTCVEGHVMALVPHKCGLMIHMSNEAQCLWRMPLALATDVCKAWAEQQQAVAA